MEARQYPAHGARVVYQRQQIGARTHFAGREPQRRSFQTGRDEKFLHGALVLEVLLGRAALDLEQRRLSDEQMPGVDNCAHLSKEEGEQQRSNMGTVDIGVGHDDDFVIARFVRVEFFAPDAAANRGDQGADFGRGQHAVKACSFHVQNLAT